MRNTSRAIQFLLLALFLVAAPSAGAISYTEEFSETYSLAPGGRVSVSNTNGHVRVIAWDRDEVQVDATKMARSFSWQ